MTKDELKRIPHLNQLIDSKIRQLEQLKAYRGRLPGYRDTEAVQSSGLSDPTAQTAAKIADLEKSIVCDIDQLVDLKREARQLIKSVDCDMRVRAVMEMRYLECMGWDEIASKVGYTMKHVLKLHGIGLAKLYP